MRHIVAIRYPLAKEAEHGIVEGTIKETIVRGEGFRENDTVLLHGFGGEDYRTAWTWRKEVVLKEAIPLSLNADGISEKKAKYKWSDKLIKRIAKNSGLNPATGEHLKELIEAIYGKLPANRPEHFTVIRW